MKIGFIGNIANNMYLMAGCFRALGHEATYFHIPSPSVFCHPLWEDGDYFVSRDALKDPNTVRDLRRSWKKPDWVVEQRSPVWVDKARRLLDCFRRLPPSRWMNPAAVREMGANLHMAFIKDLRGCDWAVSCGLPALFACERAGIPFVHITHGQDLRDAAGQKQCLFQETTARAAAQAMRRAVLCGSQGTDMIRLFKEITPPERVAALPLLYNEDLYEPTTATVDLPFLPAWARERLADDKSLRIFMPSRLSARWKGTDLFMEGFRRALAKRPGRIFLVACGWGEDYPAVRDRVEADPALASAVCFVPGMVSKNYLRHLVNTVDLVVDQFVVGWYGTAFIEAAAGGRMVLLNLDRTDWGKYLEGFEAPPSHDVSNAEEIFSLLMDIVDGRVDAAAEGRRMRSWAEKNHGMRVRVPLMMGRVRRALETAR